MSAEALLPLHKVIELRLQRILSDLGRAMATVDVAAGTLVESHDAMCITGVPASQVGLTLKMVYEQLGDVMNRIDSVNLRENSRLLVTRDPETQEVPGK